MTKSALLFLLFFVVVWCLMDMPTFLVHPELCKNFPGKIRLVFPGAAIVCYLEGK